MTTNGAKCAIKDIIDELDTFNLMDDVLAREEEMLELNNHDFMWSMGGQDEIIRVFTDLIEDDADFWNINHISDFGFYWCGCLTLEPWCELELEEETILNQIVKYHVVVGDDCVMRFANNPKSPLYRFLLKYRDGWGGNIPHSINAMLYRLHVWLLKQIEDADRYGSWTQLAYCEKCECGYFSDDYKCPECKTEFVFD